MNHKPKFERKCAELKTSMYDVVTGKDTFANTTSEIAEYIGRKFDDAVESSTRVWWTWNYAPLTNQLLPLILMQQ